MLNKTYLITIFAFILLIEVAAIAVINMPETVEAGSNLTISIIPDKKAGVLKYTYIYNESNYWKATIILNCPQYICRDSVQTTYKIPSDWLGKYFYRVYDYSINGWVKTNFTVVPKPICIDNDLDRFFVFDSVKCPSGNDCNDNNAAISPGATETCDGIDNNCDNTIDEGCEPTFVGEECKDNDKDSYGVGFCPPPQDCDDNNAAINPGATEICSITTGDENCDGESNYDSQDGLHGDKTCSVGIDAITAPTAAQENTNIEVTCTSTVANVNSISAKIDTVLCSWKSWSSSDAIFNCNTGLIGTKTLTCFVDTTKSYAVTGKEQKTQSITISSSGCEGLSQNQCTSNAICDWCLECSNSQYSNGVDRCVPKGECSYTCSKNKCTATCDNTLGGCTSTQTCNQNTCQCETPIIIISVQCTDNDNDGYGNPASSTCTNPQLDCDDNNINVNPGATEVCDNLDNNCNGLIDDQITCGDSDNDKVIDSLDICPGTLLGKEVNHQGCELPKYDLYENSYTTNFSGVSDLTSVSNVVIEVPGVGKIEFLEPINFVGLDLDSSIKIIPKSIEVDIVISPVLNKKARITFYNVDLDSPIVQRDGLLCGKCQFVSYSNREYVFSVDSI